MKSPPGLAVPLLLSLLAGCAKPATTAPGDPEKEKSGPRPIAVPGPGLVQKEQPPPKPAPAPAPVRRENPEVVKNKEAGVLSGVVRWEGAVPERAGLRLRVDAASRGVAGAVARVLGGKSPEPARPEAVALSLEAGEYRPHVLMARKGGTVELGTIEERADFEAAGASTFSAAIRRGEHRTFPLSDAGLIVVRSLLQPGRTPAYVWVFDDTPAALTAEDGRFRLPKLPAGEYELALWHEDWHADQRLPRTARVRLALGPDEGAEVRWTLAE